MDLSAMPSRADAGGRMVQPRDRSHDISQTPIPAGSSSQSFNPPFSGDAVLYLVDTAGHKLFR